MPATAVGWARPHPPGQGHRIAKRHVTLALARSWSRRKTGSASAHAAQYAAGGTRSAQTLHTRRQEREGACASPGIVLSRPPCRRANARRPPNLAGHCGEGVEPAALRSTPARAMSGNRAISFCRRSGNKTKLCLSCERDKPVLSRGQVATPGVGAQGGDAWGSWPATRVANARFAKVGSSSAPPAYGDGGLGGGPFRGNMVWGAEGDCGKACSLRTVCTCFVWPSSTANEASGPGDLLCPLCRHGRCPGCDPQGWSGTHDAALRDACAGHGIQLPQRAPGESTVRAARPDYALRTFTAPAQQTSTSACSLMTLLSGRCFTKRPSAWPMPASPPRSLRQSAWAGWWPYANRTDGCVRWSLAMSSGWSRAPWRSSLARVSNWHASRSSMVSARELGRKRSRRCCGFDGPVRRCCRGL